MAAMGRAGCLRVPALFHARPGCGGRDLSLVEKGFCRALAPGKIAALAPQRGTVGYADRSAAASVPLMPFSPFVLGAYSGEDRGRFRLVYVRKRVRKKPPNPAFYFRNLRKMRKRLKRPRLRGEKNPVFRIGTAFVTPLRKCPARDAEGEKRRAQRFLAAPFMARMA